MCMYPRRRVLAAALVLASTSAFAGNINPPAGPVGPTMKPLDQVEPRTAVNASNTPGDASCIYKITQSGAYYLTGNLFGVPNKDGIQIAASNVTLDLNGFTIFGAAGSNVGINVSASEAFIVRNGVIRGFNSYGVYSNLPGGTFENLTINNNNNGGIFVGNSARISNCIARNNDGVGIATGSSCLIQNCVATTNGANNTHRGIAAGDRCTVIACVATENHGDGIFVGHGGRVIDCQSSYNDTGIETYGTGFVTGCLCQSNSTDGINAGDGSTVRNCSCDDNGDDGIQAESECNITGNTCQHNGQPASGAGVYVTGSNCRIEDNHFNSNHYGILVGGGIIENFIVRNTARNNIGSNYSVPAGNAFAPVVSGTTFSAATPWSNFAY